MLIDKLSNNIIVISYPVGGGGYFVYTALAMYGRGVAHPTMEQFDFDSRGTCHRSVVATPIFRALPDDYALKISKMRSQEVQGKKILVLSDHEDLIDVDYAHTRQHFPNATIVRITVDQDTADVIYRTAYEKPRDQDLIQTLQQQHALSDQHHSSLRSWMRQHFRNRLSWFQQHWQPVQIPGVINFPMKKLIFPERGGVAQLIRDLSLSVSGPVALAELCHRYRDANLRYYRWMLEWPDILSAIKNSQDQPLDHITDIYDQTMIDLRIERNWNCQLPDSPDWFQNTRQIRDILIQR